MASKINVPAGTRSTLENAIETLFIELEDLAKNETVLTSTMIAKGGNGITKGLGDIIADFVADCEYTDT